MPVVKTNVKSYFSWPLDCVKGGGGPLVIADVKSYYILEVYFELF